MKCEKVRKYLSNNVPPVLNRDLLAELDASDKRIEDLEAENRELKQNHHDVHCNASRDTYRYSAGCSCGNIEDRDKLKELEAENKQYRKALEKIGAMYTGMVYLCETQSPHYIAQKALEENWNV